MDTPYASLTESTLESFIAICPLCNHRCVYHRTADLRDPRPIDLKRVVCQSPTCAREFYINGDTISPAYRTLLFEAYVHRREKRFRECLLDLGQALELLLDRILHALLADQPFAHEHAQDWDTLTALHRAIKKTLRHASFRRLRAAVITLVSSFTHPLSTAQAREITTDLPKLWSKDSEAQLTTLIDEVVDTELRRLLHLLRTTSVVALRNAALHREAYQPSHDEIDCALTEARELLLLLPVHLDPETDLFFEILSGGADSS